MQSKPNHSSVVQFTAFAEEFPTPAWHSGSDGRCDYFNKAWFAFTGRTPEQELGDGWIQGVYPDDLDRLLATRRRSMDARRPFSVEFRLRHAGGYYQWVTCSGSPLSTTDDNFEGYAGTCFDIDEQKHLEQTLQETRERFLAFMDNLPGFAWIKDADGSYLFINRALEQCTPFDRNWRGKTDAEMFSRYLAAEYQANDRTVRSSRKPIQTIEQTLLNGSRGVALVTKFPIFDRGRQVALVGGCCVDITEQIQLEKTLQTISAELLTAEDKERRRIAREVHDSTYQNMIAVSLNLASVSASLKAAGVQPAANVLDETLSLVTESARELRTLAYALHPPALDDMGLVPAIRAYIEGFSRRSGINIALELPVEDQRFPDSVELALFRIVQEGLSNIYRHAGTQTASLRLVHLSGSVTLEIRDQGLGIAALASNPHTAGVGIAGMRQRLRPLKGQLEIANGNPGTILRVKVPLKDAP